MSRFKLHVPNFEVNRNKTVANVSQKSKNNEIDLDLGLQLDSLLLDSPVSGKGSSVKLLRDRKTEVKA